MLPHACSVHAGGWNDIDALIGTNEDTAVHLTKAQSRTQFNLWSVLSAQLIIGGSILKLNDYDLQTYTNKEIIAINQVRACVYPLVFDCIQM